VILRLVFTLFFLLLSAPVWAVQSIAILPFTNKSDRQQMYWLGEGFAESLGEELLLKDGYVIQRPERKAAYEELQLPYSSNLSRATMLKIGERLAADYVVFGSYNFKGKTLVADARVVKLRTATLGPQIKAEGSIGQLYQVQMRLRDGLRQYFSKQGLRASPATGTSPNSVSLDAYESYIKGLLESSDAQKIKFFQEALKAAPRYVRAGYRLGLTLQRSGKYRDSNEVLNKIAVSGAFKNKIDFLYALNLYHLQDFQPALDRLLQLSVKAPTAEVYNNIGITYQKQNKSGEALWYFSKAVESDRQFADYHFNIASSYLQKQEPDSAVYHYRETVRLKPNDYQALYFLSKSLEKKNPQASSHVRAYFQETLPTDQKSKFPQQYSSMLPLLRVSQTYLTAEERQYRNQRQKMKMDQLATYVETYKNNARRYIDDDIPEKAILEAKKGVSLARLEWYLHYLLGRSYLQQKQVSQAKSELHFSLWCLENVDSHLLLAEIYREAGQYEQAKLQIQQTLALDPNNKKAMEIWSKIYNKFAKGK